MPGKTKEATTPDDVTRQKIHGENGHTSPAPDVEFPPREERPCYRAYQFLFRTDDGEWHPPGIYWHGVAGKEDAKNKNNRHEDDPLEGINDHAEQAPLIDLCFLSYVNILGIVRTPESTEHSYLMEYSSKGEEGLLTEVLLQSLLVGRAEELMKSLRGMGVTALYKNRELIRSWLDDQHLRFHTSSKSHFWTSLKAVGWYGPDTFVLPKQVIGTKRQIWFHRKGKSPYDNAGDMETWKNRVALPCQNNPLLIFTLSTAFAGPLLKLLGVPGVGFQLAGDSTTGKTTALNVAASPWGPPEFVMSWRATANGLESSALVRCDTLTLLDESHLIDPKQLDTAIYMLANGESKQRMNRDASAKDIVHWRNCVLSSGERTIESHLETAHIDHKAGQGVRIIDMDAVGKFGLFDDLHGAKDGNAFSQSLRKAAEEHYGFAGPMFVEWLISNAALLDLRAQLDTFFRVISKDLSLSAQEGRVARSLALCALAGELAIEAQILPWPYGSAIDAVTSIFRRWRGSQPKSSSSVEHSKIMELMSDFTDRHGDTRFTDIDDTSEAPKAFDRAGYYENVDGKRLFLFNASGLRDSAKGFPKRRIIQALVEAGALTQSGYGSEKAVNRRTPGGGQAKLYHVDPEKLSQPINNPSQEKCL